MIFQLIYTCALADNVSDDELRKIANHAAKTNAAKGVTGVLLCKDGSALQVLEGERGVVEALYQHINRDPRIKSSLVMIRRDAVKREFPTWSMGFRNANDTHAAFDLCAENFPSAMPENPSTEVKAISRAFARVNGLAYA